MKRAGLIALVAVLCMAQHTRDAYRAAYRAWREADPALERDAAGGGPAIAQRADRMAAESAKFAAARKVFLEGFAQEQMQQVSWLEGAAPGPEPPFLDTAYETQFMAAENATLTRTINAFATDRDKGIQQLRLALTKERTELDALGQAIAERRKATDAAAATVTAIGDARGKALEQTRAMLTAANELPGEIEREGQRWTEYYRKLGEGAKGEATPITVVPPGVPAVVPNNPVVAPPTITPVPLARYVGSWTYPVTNGLYHGAQPVTVDVQVDERNGQARGSFAARFRVPQGSSADPVLRFDFSGPFQPTRRQVFNLVTSDGTKGTVELIPGPAFNLLEVNFQTEARTNKIRQADVIVVKK